METIFRCSEYGFLKIDQVCEPDKTVIELAALCVDGIYGAAFIVEDGILHIIFDPEKISLDEIGRAVEQATCIACFKRRGQHLLSENSKSYGYFCRKHKKTIHFIAMD